MNVKRTTVVRTATWFFSLATVLAGLMLAVGPFGAQAQAPRDSDVQVYALDHRQAADLEPVIRRMLAASSAQAEVVRDPNANRLIIRGGAEAQRLAAQMVRSLDQPPQETAPAEAERAELRSYGVAADQLVDTEARLRARFGRFPEIKIATDSRDSKILVMAPPDAHDAVQRALADRTPERTEQPATARTTLPNGSIGLKHITPRDLEADLSGIFGARIARSPETQEGVSNWRIASAIGGPIELEINHAARNVRAKGPATTANAALRLVAALDTAPAPGETMRVIPVRSERPGAVRNAVLTVEAATKTLPAPGAEDAAELVIAQNDNERQPAAQGERPQPDRNAIVEAAEAAVAEDRGVTGQVKIEYLENLNQIIVSGNQRDVERVMKIIEEIEQLSAETAPRIEVYHLKHVASASLADILTPLNTNVLSPRQGSVSITSLVKPNALLLIGRDEAVKTLIGLIEKLDTEVDPYSTFKTFRLKHANASEIAETISDFFEERGETNEQEGGQGNQDSTGLNPRVVITADVRSNSLVVQASPRDMIEISTMVEELDTGESAAVNVIEIIKLQNTLAEELAPILQEAINSQGAATGGQGGGDGGGGSSSAAKSLMLQFMTIDSQGQRRLSSGILTDVKITADPRANALILSAPADSIELLKSLVRQLDSQPNATAVVKIFTIANGDATALAEVLQNLFGQQSTTQQGGGNQGGFNFGGFNFGGGAQATTSSAQGATGVVVPLRFTVDTRTNSIIASGTEAELDVVHGILRLLDTGDTRDRETNVYRLQNAPAIDVANAINEFLNNERTIDQEATSLSPFEQLEREVVVVPEVVSNSLIVSATPRYYSEIERIVRELDARPPNVMIQVLIGEVTLNNTDEFGVELGLQDSLLFDRSSLTEIENVQNSVQTSTPAGVVTTTTNVVQNAILNPGFLFGVPGAPLGNSGSTQSLATRDKVAGQGVTTFGVGRTNSDLGFGGLVLSASSDTVSLLIRALRESRRLEVLSRPMITTLDNQPAFIQVGERVPRITDSTIGTTGTTNATTLEDVGLIVQVQPRVSPDGMVSMLINAEKSALGPEAEGIPISINVNGDIIRSPRIATTRAQTTISALGGQTVVLGGLITKSKSNVSRRVPMLSEVPILGNLFRYDSVAQRRTELLIIMTPHIIRSEIDAERAKQIEAARMSWCLADVRRIHGDPGMTGVNEDQATADTIVVYPDKNPRGEPIDSTVKVIEEPSEITTPNRLPEPTGRLKMKAAPTE